MLGTIRLIAVVLLYCVTQAITPHVVSGAPVTSNKQTRTLEQTVHLSPPGDDDSRYVYVPFNVPANTTRVIISYQYEHAGGANTIDIGLFDARSSGTDTDPRGFRGWSGGRRSEFSVSRNEATPGYMPGEMPVGTWRIILGLYKVSPTGVDINFKIAIETDKNSSLSRAQLPRKTDLSPDNASTTSTMRRGARHWWRGDLHMHTVHSDGEWTIAELVSSAVINGLDFISITDHNTASHHAEIDRLRTSARKPLVLRGEEITTYNGHTNAWGIPSGKWIDFRVRVGDDSRMSGIVAEAHRAGAVISINHPYALCGGCSWSYDLTAQGFDAIEVWNGTWDATDEQALKMWDKILQSGRHITAIASSDSHRQVNAIGLPTTHIAANNLSQTALLNSIRQGHVYLTGEVAQPVISFEAEAVARKHVARTIIGDVMRLNAPAPIKLFINHKATPTDATISLISNGEVIRRFAIVPDSSPQTVVIECRQDSYFRIEIREKTGTVIALTNPIYVKVATGQ